MPKMNEAGFALLRQWEGCVLEAYDDADGKVVKPGGRVRGILTIGYGHTGPDVVPGLVWTKAQAEAELQREAAAFANRIAPLIKGELTDNQFSALVCLAYNIGVGAFGDSSALRHANAKNFADVPASIAKWNKTTIDGVRVESNGLKNRRAAEVALWNTP